MSDDDQCEAISGIGGSTMIRRCRKKATERIAGRRVCCRHRVSHVFHNEDGVGEEQRERQRRVLEGL